MSDSILSAPYFHNDEAAYEFVEGKLWPNGPVCPKCGVIGNAAKLRGKSTRIGVYKCRDCRKPFTVKVGTVFEDSHIKMNVWLQAIYLVASSKKGISSNQLHRSLGITLKSAWFMSHRIREAMKDLGMDQMGGWGANVEVDETYIGRDYAKKPHGEKRGRGFTHKYKVLTLIDRSIGRSRSVVIDSLRGKHLRPYLAANIREDSRILTDEAGMYRYLKNHFDEHLFNRHRAGVYVSKEDPTIHTNTVEGFFSIFKRGMKGVYQHCAHSHLQRYVTEFDFRYNYRKANGYSDQERAEQLLRGVVGKRLTYETTTV